MIIRPFRSSLAPDVSPLGKPIAQDAERARDFLFLRGQQAIEELVGLG